MYFFSSPSLDVELTKESVTVYVVPNIKLPATLSVTECTVTVNDNRQIIFDINRDKIDLYNEGDQPTLIVKQKIESRPASSKLVEKNEGGWWEDQVTQDTQIDTIHFPSCVLENAKDRKPGEPPSSAWKSLDTPQGIFEFSQMMSKMSGSGIEAQFETPTQEEADKMNKLMGDFADGKCEVENITFDLEKGVVSSDVLPSNP